MKLREINDLLCGDRVYMLEDENLNHIDSIEFFMNATPEEWSDNIDRMIQLLIDDVDVITIFKFHGEMTIRCRVSYKKQDNTQKGEEK